MHAFFTLAAGTLVSEDLTCIAAGVLIQQGRIDPFVGVLACIVGIFAGDVGLWAIGRLGGSAALEWPWAARALASRGAGEMARWLRRNAAGAILGSRFLPGARLPLYLLAGTLDLPGRVFAGWALVATVLWTPAVVLTTASLGSAFAARFAAGGAALWPWLAGGAVFLLLRVARALAAPSRRMRILARLARWSRWEFWPMWLFYAPVALWIALLAIRHRGLSTITAANPGMADGGTVGESKFEILARLPAESVIPSMLVEPGPASERVGRVDAHMRSARWSFPLVLKPDVGQRGMGVRVARSIGAVEEYLARASGAVLVQPYHAGPFEAGVFYYRMPGRARGRILSITDKHFPFVAGDGRSTLEELIWAHPRHRLQAGTFLRRHAHALARVLGAGERFQLAVAGNHAQGTLFRDGRHLATPALERRIDEIARQFGGFFVGRFDIRYGDVESFKAGRDLAIVELNGATAESTNIYDPDLSLAAAYRQLFRQWSIVFAIGAANRANGARVTSHRRLLELVRAHLAAECPFPISD